MNLGKNLRLHVPAALALAALLLGGCHSGSSSSGLNAISSAVQDLAGDPEGTTTVITYASTTGLAAATAANFAANGGQTAQSILVAGSQVTVTWDLRVSPSSQVRAVGLADVASTFHAVTTSDASAPTFVISGTQNPGLGGDTISVAFSGPHVVQSEAENLANWALTTDGQALDLAGSTFLLDVPTQVLSVTLGTSANLHANFTLAATSLHSVADTAVASAPVAGNATGDTTAPTLVSADQNLAQDPYGRVVDFTFDKAMDPVFSIGLSHFVVVLPDIATTVEQPSEDVLRVTFNAPIVPGYDTVTLTSLVDLHGNAFPDTVQAISQPSPVVNSFAGNVQAVTVANSGGDYVAATTTQALDPDTATLAASWTLTVAGTPVDLTQQLLTYDFPGKTLTIDLAFDLVNGQSFTLQGVGALDVDGQVFALGQTQTVTGDTAPPTATGGLQNRSQDPTGMTVDVQMSEDVDQATAETLSNWASSGGQNVLSATLQPGLDLVRLVFDGPMVPGDVTLSAQNVKDLAGNVMVPQAGIVLTSTDTTPPTVVSHEADANEGANNDVIELVFDDDLVLGDISDTTRWALESPIGTPRVTAGATVLYDSTAKRARLKLTNGVNLHRDDDFSVTLTGVRDLGGNPLAATAFTGPVLAETTLPYVHTVWRPSASPDQLEVRFSEPCDLLTDPGTRFVLRDSSGVQRGLASSVTSMDSGLGARVSFGIVVATTDTIDVIGPTDLAGNPLFPALLVPSIAEDPTPPSLGPGLSTLVSVTGEDNDFVSVRFDRPVSPWTITDHVHYTISGPSAIVKRTRELTFNGVDTVVIPIRSNNNDYDLLTGAGYDILLDGVTNAQGVPMPAPQTQSGILVTGDSTAPNVLAGKVRIDHTNPTTSLLVEFTEAVAPPSATNTANYLYDGVSVPTSAAIVSPRVVRLTFAVTPAVGHALSLNVADRAGNASGALALTVSAEDTTAPLVVSVDGLLRPGFGGDEVHVLFDEPITPATALTAANYTVQSGGLPRSLTGAALSYSSGANQVTIKLAGGQDLKSGGALSVGVSGIKDVAGNQMPSPIQVGGTATGDSTPPAFSKAFVNYRADPTGAVVDVLFSEDVDGVFATNTANWTATGRTVLSVVLREKNHARVTLSGALSASGTLQITGLLDVAQNASGAISIDPVE